MIWLEEQTTGSVLQLWLLQFKRSSQLYVTAQNKHKRKMKNGSHKASHCESTCSSHQGYAKPSILCSVYTLLRTTKLALLKTHFSSVTHLITLQPGKFHDTSPLYCILCKWIYSLYDCQAHHGHNIQLHLGVVCFYLYGGSAWWWSHTKICHISCKIITAVNSDTSKPLSTECSMYQLFTSHCFTYKIFIFFKFLRCNLLETLCHEATSFDKNMRRKDTTENSHTTVLALMLISTLVTAKVLCFSFATACSLDFTGSSETLLSICKNKTRDTDTLQAKEAWI